MATAHLIHGYLGAGKTTFARHLEHELPAIRFSHDEWMTILYGNDPPMDQFPEFHQRVSRLIDAHWTRCVKLGLDVVLDLGFWSRRQRDETRTTAAALGASARLYLLECPEDEAWRRVDKRNAHLDGSLLIVRHTFEMLKSRFQPLGDDEDRIEVRQC
ncbi:ATP-binding protein [Bradyrhizobium manausense]|uniref:AAA family ATPase n=1 Tax=Bradyrhizobium manausense TaxID=989370 RepID=UPI001BA81B9A|nr:ATP-binding protein [Bradyrhizobium manausense]MBR0835765.1 ATP-binding protein [Bradyrhizobium manausense]